jgi:hypothetical protein
VVVLLLLGMASSPGCMPPEPYVRYSGNVVKRAPKPANTMAVYRTSPPERGIQSLGTVIVTCPSEMAPNGWGGATAVGGCSYGWAVHAAAERAASVGADGIHSVATSVNGAGNVVSLTASTFMYTSDEEPAPAAAKSSKPSPSEETTVEARLKHLEKLKADGLITPEEYEKKRAEILKEI